MGSGGGDAAGGAALAEAAAVPASSATLGVDEAGEAAAADVVSGVAAPLPAHAVSVIRKNDARRMAHSARFALPAGPLVSRQNIFP
jgi:hypothetical protein